MSDPFAKFEFDAPTREKLAHYAALLREANAKVNLLSRKDTDALEYRHIAFCAAISKFLIPDAGARIADVGTGGGLPGIVEAILYPQANVFMFDGVGKKIRMISDFIRELKLDNAEARNTRIEEFKSEFEYATGRSVCALPLFFGFVKKRLKIGHNGNLPNGVVYFKGGELEPELVSKKILPDAEFDLREFFSDSDYEGKRIVAFNTKKVLAAAKHA